MFVHPTGNLVFHGHYVHIIIHFIIIIITFNLAGDLAEHASTVDHQKEIGPVATSEEQRIYNALKDEKNVRKQFENRIKTDFETALTNAEIKFTNLKDNLSAVIDRKLDNIGDNVRASVTVLNNASSAMENLTIKVQQNDKYLASLMIESKQLNTTFLRHYTRLEQNEFHIESNLQQNNEYLTNLRIESDQLNSTLVDVRASVEELIDNSHRYKGIYYHI